VGPEKTIVGASSQPVNPYIEAELTGPSGTETRRAFSKFPEFDSMHGTTSAQAMQLTFETPQSEATTAPIEVFSGPDGRLFARFRNMGSIVSTTELTLGSPVETPWQDWKFVVRQRREKARWERTVEPVPLRKEGREPAIQLAVGGPAEMQQVWVLHGHAESVKVAGRFYDLQFDDASWPIDFQMKLEGFRVVTYPGTQKPRSFESRVTIQDPRAGGEMSQVISMNHPLSYGGYTFYQSSFNKAGERYVSVLSVSRDPGTAVVFAGYIALVLGMVWVLVKRMTESKRSEPTVGSTIGKLPAAK
jgi:hypothetical protein